MRYEKYYFVQYSPSSQEEMKNMIIDYIEQSEVLEDAKNNGADYVALNFMFADFKLPIYFEENKSYFKMDDYISHYVRTNRIALYTYNFEDEEDDVIIYQK